MNAQHIARVWVSSSRFGSLEELVAQKVLYLVSEEYTDDQIYANLMNILTSSVAPESLREVYRAFINEVLAERTKEWENGQV